MPLSESDNAKLKQLYYSSDSPGSFGGWQRLLREARKEGIANKGEVKQWLRRQFTYTLHHPARRRFNRNPTVVAGAGNQVQMDLVDLSMFASSNDGYRFILTAIDSFSKKAHTECLKNKAAGTVLKAVANVVAVLDPACIFTDAGTEFKNRQLKEYLNGRKIAHFIARNPVTKASIVERFNRTLKEMMFRLMTSRGSRRYIDAIDKIVESYNASPHRSIGMAPNDVNHKTEQAAFQRLYRSHDINSLFNGRFRDKQWYHVGDSVRMKYVLQPFDKSYYPTFGDQVFTVSRVVKGPYRFLYKVKDWQGKEVDRAFYREELLLIDKDTDYRIEKVIRRRGSKALVKFLNYPSSANEWINASDITAIG